MPLRVSLTMIVKNEEANLPACLDSVAGLFREIIVVDTGSTDRSKEIAARYGAKVFDFPWCDDFAAARNASLDHATGNWIFWLDADDRLDEENRRKLKALFAGLKDENVAYVMQSVSKQCVGDDSVVAVDYARLFRNHPEIRWQYRVHEQILPSVRRLGGSVRSTDIFTCHMGYQDKALHRRKLDRNLRLLELAGAEHPKDPFILYQLGRTQLATGRTTEAVQHLRHALDLSQPTDFFVRQLYGQLARGYCQLGWPAEALDVCRAARVNYDDYAELAFLEGQLLDAQGDLAGAEACFLRLLQPGARFVGDDSGLCGYKARQNLAVIYYRQRRYKDAESQWRAVVADRPDFVPAWLSLANLWLAQDRLAEVEEAATRLQGKAAGTAAAALLRALAHMFRRDFPAAKQILIEMIARDQRAFWPRALLGDLLLQEGRDLAGAEQALREASSLNPDHLPTLRKLKLLLEQRGPGRK